MIVVAGGDGTVNEVVNGIMSNTDVSELALAVVPFGTANDFATGCGIPVGNPTEALRLAVSGAPTPIDVGKINDRYFVNALVMGFGRVEFVEGNDFGGNRLIEVSGTGQF